MEHVDVGVDKTPEKRRQENNVEGDVERYLWKKCQLV